MKHTRPYSILAMSAVAVLPALRAAAAPPTATNSNRPNVILCMTDDQGWGDVSYNGLKQIRTPNIDAMAAAGIRFNRFYAQPSCSPTRACVMTGRHPNRMGVFWPGMKLRNEELTIAQAVKLAGYSTGHFGKWHLNGVAGPGKVMPDSDPLSPRNCGFDESFSVSNYFEADWTFGHNGVPEKTTGDGSDVIVERALKFIGTAADQKKPFLAVIWFGSPHAPYQPTPEDLKAAGGSGYFGEMLGVDRSLGTLRAGLTKMGLADNTMLWFSSDNGGWIEPAHPAARGTNLDLRGRKGDVLDGGIRVPGLIVWPARIKQPRITEFPAGLVDIFPTVMDVLQIKLDHPVPLDGISLLPMIEGKMTERPQALGFWQYNGNPPAITTDSGPSAWNDNQYKLVKSAPNHWELYDMTIDRSEKYDISGEHPDVVKRMKAELEAWQLSVIHSYQGNDMLEARRP